jgi:hypothetical protein
MGVRIPDKRDVRHPPPVDRGSQTFRNFVKPLLKPVLIALVVASMPIGVPRGNALLPWPLARDLISQVAAGEGASSSGAASNQVIAGRDV